VHFHAAELTKRASEIHAWIEAGDLKRISMPTVTENRQDIATYLNYLYFTRREEGSDSLLRRMNVDMEPIFGPSDFMRARTHTETLRPQK
jgi:hypothetical protein